MPSVLTRKTRPVEAFPSDPLGPIIAGRAQLADSRVEPAEAAAREDERLREERLVAIAGERDPEAIFLSLLPAGFGEAVRDAGEIVVPAAIYGLDAQVGDLGLELLLEAPNFRDAAVGGLEGGSRATVAGGLAERAVLDAFHTPSECNRCARRRARSGLVMGSGARKCRHFASPLRRGSPRRDGAAVPQEPAEETGEERGPARMASRAAERGLDAPRIAAPAGAGVHQILRSSWHAEQPARGTSAWKPRAWASSEPVTRSEDEIAISMGGAPSRVVPDRKRFGMSRPGLEPRILPPPFLAAPREPR